MPTPITKLNLNRLGELDVPNLKAYMTGVVLEGNRKTLKGVLVL